jgi:hypothetical protein
MQQSIMEECRKIASRFLEAKGQDHHAVVVRDGHGDDFPEVQAILFVLREQSERMTRYEQALNCYRDESFWEEASTGSLAEHDRGEMARNVLSGRTPFRDVC